MRTSKKRQKSTRGDNEGCRGGRRVTPDRWDRHADVIGQAMLRRTFPGF